MKLKDTIYVTLLSGVMASIISPLATKLLISDSEIKIELNTANISSIETYNTLRPMFSVNNINANYSFGMNITNESLTQEKRKELISKFNELKKLLLSNSFKSNLNQKLDHIVGKDNYNSKIEVDYCVKNTGKSEITLKNIEFEVNPYPIVENGKSERLKRLDNMNMGPLMPGESSCLKANFNNTYNLMIPNYRLSITAAPTIKLLSFLYPDISISELEKKQEHLVVKYGNIINLSEVKMSDSDKVINAMLDEMQ